VLDNQRPLFEVHGQNCCAKAASWGVRILILAASLLILAGFAWAARAYRTARPNPTRN